MQSLLTAILFVFIVFDGPQQLLANLNITSCRNFFVGRNLTDLRAPCDHACQTREAQETNCSSRCDDGRTRCIARCVQRVGWRQRDVLSRCATVCHTRFLSCVISCVGVSGQRHLCCRQECRSHSGVTQCYAGCNDLVSSCYKGCSRSSRLCTDGCAAANANESDSCWLNCRNKELACERPCKTTQWDLKRECNSRCNLLVPTCVRACRSATP